MWSQGELGQGPGPSGKGKKTPILHFLTFVYFYSLSSKSFCFLSAPAVLTAQCKRQYRSKRKHWWWEARHAWSPPPQFHHRSPRLHGLSHGASKFWSCKSRDHRETEITIIYKWMKGLLIFSRTFSRTLYISFFQIEGVQCINAFFFPGNYLIVFNVYDSKKQMGQEKVWNWSLMRFFSNLRKKEVLGIKYLILNSVSQK